MPVQLVRETSTCALRRAHACTPWVQCQCALLRALPCAASTRRRCLTNSTALRESPGRQRHAARRYRCGAHAYASAHVEELSAQRSAHLAACACGPSAACCLSCRARARASRAARSRGRRGTHKSIAAHAPYSASVVAAITLFNIASVVACYHTSTFPRASAQRTHLPQRRAAVPPLPATSPRGAMLPVASYRSCRAAAATAVSSVHLRRCRKARASRAAAQGVPPAVYARFFATGCRSEVDENRNIRNCTFVIKNSHNEAGA